MLSLTGASSNSIRRRVDDRLQRIIDLHFDPRHGSAFWLRRAAQRGIDPRERVRTTDDLALLGELTQSDLSGQSLDDLVPRALHREWPRMIVGQTGGTTGRSIWTAYRDDEFRAAFVDPFVAAADSLGFPRGLRWLFVGPSGPHVIGKAMRCLASAMDSPDPYSVDLDPRWARTLAAGSFAARRYLAHVVEQAVGVIREQPVDVLFATPTVLDALADALTEADRERIRAVHYGGVAMTVEQMRRFQVDRFPCALHLAGYGNTLFGCCLELSAAVGRQLDYLPHGNRLLIETIDANGRPAVAGERGRVCFTRLDETVLIVRMVERDEAVRVPPPSLAPIGFELPGVRNPGPPVESAEGTTHGLY